MKVSEGKESFSSACDWSYMQLAYLPSSRSNTKVGTLLRIRLKPEKPEL